jgi:iron complex outermembrane receptor protein
MKGTSLPARRARAVVCSFLLVLTSRRAVAQSADPASPPLDPASSASTAAPTATIQTPTADVPEIGELVVVGRRTRTEAGADRTASATVVSADRFAGEAKGVAELVATAPGVAVNDYGGLGRLATASIRGSNADGVLVLLDGLPLNTSFGGGVDLSSIPRGWIDRIEVVRGMEGAHYGAGALGGVVNVVTRRAAPGAWSAEAVGGSFRTVGASADRALRVGDGGGLLLALAFDGSRGEFPYDYDAAETDPTNSLEDRTRAHNGSARGGALAKLSVPLGPVRLDTVAEVSGGRRELPPEKGHDADGSRDWQEDARGLLAVRAVVPGPAPGMSLAGKGLFRLDALDTRLASLGGVVRRQRGGAASGGSEALLDHAFGMLRVDASAGSEWLDADDAGGRHRRATLAAGVSDELRLARGRVRIAPAVRYDRTGEFDGASGKLGVAVALAGPLSARASAGRTFRAPSFAELYLQQGLAQPNPELRSETGTGADASLVVDAPAGMVSVGGHATRYQDLIVWETASFGRLKPFNTGEALVAGVEAEAASAPIRGLAGVSLSTAYTWLFTRNLRGPEGIAGKDLPRRPRHRLYARAGFAPGAVAAHLEAHFVGQQWEDPRNVNAVDAALLWNAGTSVTLDRARSVALALEVRNIFDDRTAEDPLGNPMPGRMVLVSLRAGASKRAEVTP